MPVTLDFTDRVLNCIKAASVNDALLEWRFYRVPQQDGSFLLGINGIPLMTIETDEQAMWLCEILNTHLWRGVNEILDCHEAAMADVFRNAPRGQSIRESIAAMPR